MQYQYDPTKLIDTVLIKFDNKNRFNTFIKNRATSSIMNTCVGVHESASSRPVAATFSAPDVKCSGKHIDSDLMYSNLIWL